MTAKDNYVFKAQVQSVTRGQKKDVVKVGKGEMVSTISLDAGEIEDLEPGEGVWIKIEIDPKLDFSDGEE